MSLPNFEIFLIFSSFFKIVRFYIWSRSTTHESIHKQSLLYEIPHPLLLSKSNLYTVNSKHRILPKYCDQVCNLSFQLSLEERLDLRVLTSSTFPFSFGNHSFIAYAKTFEEPTCHTVLAYMCVSKSKKYQVLRKFCVRTRWILLAKM